MYRKQLAFACCAATLWSGVYAADTSGVGAAHVASAVTGVPSNVRSAPAPTRQGGEFQPVIKDVTSEKVAPAPVTGQPPQVEFAVAAIASPTKPRKKHRPVMPGVEKGNGTKLNTSLTRANIVKVTGDGTEIALVSAKFPNRIATPFAHPKIIDASSVVMQIDGSNIYLSPKGAKPFAIYITGDAPGDQVVSLTLEPHDIPAQTLILQLEENSVAKRAAKTESYTQQLVELLRDVAAGRIPEGYSEGRMPNMFAKQDGLNIVPEKRYSGSWLDVYRYKVENNQSTTIELSETQFYQKGVKAVSIFPTVTLGKGDTTTVFVVADKSVLDRAGDDDK